MKTRVNDYDFACPVEAALDVVGGKWKGVILFHLLERTIRFNEFRRLLPGVTQRVLTLQLRELEEVGIVCRTVYAEVPPRVEYSLTELGLTLQSVIRPMRDWGPHCIKSVAARQRAGDDIPRAD